MPVPETQATNAPPRHDPRQRGQAAELAPHAAIIARRQPPFFFVHHPTNWDVVVIDGKPELVPSLDAVPRVEGTCGVRTLDRHEDPKAQVKDFTDYQRGRGAVVIPLETIVPKACLPEGDSEGPYWSTIDVIEPGTKGPTVKSYIDAWTVLIDTAPNQPQRFDRAKDAYNRWRLHLVKTGVVAPIVESVRRDMLARANKHVQNRQTAPTTGEVREAQIGEAKGAKQRLEAALAKAAA